MQIERVMSHRPQQCTCRCSADVYMLFRRLLRQMRLQQAYCNACLCITSVGCTKQGLRLRNDADRRQPRTTAVQLPPGLAASADASRHSNQQAHQQHELGRQRGCLEALRGGKQAVQPNSGSDVPAAACATPSPSTDAALAAWSTDGDGPSAGDLLKCVVPVECSRLWVSPRVRPGRRLPARSSAQEQHATQLCCAPSANASLAQESQSACRRLRWATLGPQYDWTRRRYGPADAAPALPRYLRDFATRAARAAARVLQGVVASPGRLDGRDTDSSGGWDSGDADAAAYEPNAALVNFYSGEGDTLCGHKVRQPRTLR